MRLNHELSTVTAGLSPRYRVDGLLGEGACGMVYSAVRSEDEHPVAIKVLKMALTENVGVRHRFDREIEILARLDHPHVVRLHEAGQLAGRPFLVMDRIDGNDLREVVNESRPQTDELMTWLTQAASALARAHDVGVIHRDVKPANVLIDVRRQALVTDFGLASGADFEDLTRTGTFVGTPLYMAPEQFLGVSPDPAMDVFSLGAMAFAILEGRQPHSAPGLGELLAAKERAPKQAPRLRSTVGADMEAIVLACLAGPPAERPVMREVVTAFERRAPMGVLDAVPPTAPLVAVPSREAVPDIITGPLASKFVGTTSVALDLPDEPLSRGGMLLRSVGFMGLLVGSVALGFHSPSSPPGTQPVATQALSTPPINFRLALIPRGLRIRWKPPLPRPVRLKVRSSIGVEKVLDVAPGIEELDMAWAEFNPESFDVVLEDSSGIELARTRRRLAPQKLGAGPNHLPPLGSVPLSVGAELWVPRGNPSQLLRFGIGSDGLSPLAPRPASELGGVWRSGARVEGGGVLGVVRRKSGEGQLVRVGQSAETEAFPLPGRGWANCLPTPLDNKAVLLLPMKFSGERRAGVLDLETGRLRELDFPVDFHLGEPPRVAGEWIWCRGFAPSEQGHMILLRRVRDTVVVHAELLGPGGEREHVRELDYFEKTMAVSPRGIAAISTGRDVYLLDPATLPKGRHILFDLKLEQGIRRLPRTPGIPRASIQVDLRFFAGTLWATSMGEVPRSAKTLMMEEFVLLRWDLSSPETPPEELFRDPKGSKASHFGTWGGKTRLRPDPSGQWLAGTYESSPLGRQLWIFDKEGNPIYSRNVNFSSKVARMPPVWVQGGLVLGESDEQIWYVPVLLED